MLLMATKKSDPPTTEEPKRKRKQIDIDPELVNWVGEIVGVDRGEISKYLNNLLRPILHEKRMEALAEKIRTAGGNLDQLLGKKPKRE